MPSVKTKGARTKKASKPTILPSIIGLPLAIILILIMLLFFVVSTKWVFLSLVALAAWYMWLNRGAGPTAAEPFGSTSPGTMMQLATSHVPTEEDFLYYSAVYPKQLRREVADLTGGDPGPLRPWVFPTLQRGIALLPY
jgi:hypothetical protein